MKIYPEEIDPIEAIKLFRHYGCNYFVGAFGRIQLGDTVPVYHVVGYQERPIEVDMKSLTEELALDTDFDLLSLKLNVDYVLVEFDETFFE